MTFSLYYIPSLVFHKTDVLEAEIVSFFGLRSGWLHIRFPSTEEAVIGHDSFSMCRQSPYLKKEADNIYAVQQDCMLARHVSDLTSP